MGTDQGEVDAYEELPGIVGTPTVDGLPDGYTYGVTRYSDVILSQAFPDLFADIVENLEGFSIEIEEITAGGGSRAEHTKRHDNGLEARGWGTHRVSIEKRIDGQPVYRVRNHEIDVFSMGPGNSYPGIAVEMEWNNKDPFFHRDLANFATLHNEGVIAAGVIVTRGPNLQRWLECLAAVDMVQKTKYGKATTHWDKLLPMVNVGGGGQCPLLLVGIDPPRIHGWPAEVVNIMS